MLHESSHSSYLFCCPTHVLAAPTEPWISCLLPMRGRISVSVSVSILSHFQKKVYFHMQTHDFRSFVAAVSQLVFRQQTGVATVCISNASAFLNSAHLSYENRQQKHQSDIQTDFGLGEYCDPWQNLGFHRMSVKNLMRVVPPRGDSTIVGHRQITPLISSPFSFVISLISFIMFRLTHLYFSMCFSSLSFLRVFSWSAGHMAV